MSRARVSRLAKLARVQTPDPAEIEELRQWVDSWPPGVKERAEDLTAQVRAAGLDVDRDSAVQIRILSEALGGDP